MRVITPTDRLIASGFPALIPSEPQSYKEAIASPDSSEWQDAIQAEGESLLAAGTWTLTPLPVGRQAIGNRWVFKLKKNADGTVARYKARLVVQGFSQQQGVDFTEVYAPVAKFASLRIVLAIAATNNWDLRQIDVDTAFLNAPVEEEIYMQQPEGLRTAPQAGKVLVCKLQKSLYGLKQAPKNWNDMLTAYMRSQGFMQCKGDPCVFVQRASNGAILCIVVIYVDDLVLTGPNRGWIDAFIVLFGQQYKIKDMGDAAWVLGMTIHRDREAKRLHLGQEAYVEGMLERYGMRDSKPVDTPMVDTPLAVAAAASTPTDVVLYQQLVGSLLFASNSTRPDITCAIGHLARAMQAPTSADMVAAKRVLRYLKGTKDMGLVFQGGLQQTQASELLGYVDANWGEKGKAGPKTTMRSTSGVVHMLAGGCISWSSKRQASVALSTAEAELMALSAGSQETVWLRTLLQELGQPTKKPTVMMEDNQGCIALAENWMTSGRSKHIALRYFYVRELISGKVLQMQYCATKEMLADLLTKPMKDVARHKELVQMLLGKKNA
jgi:hypothetical protein